MIIIEGSDGAGKSSVVKWIKSKGVGVIKPYYPKVNQLSYYLHSGAHYSGYFLERYYISELVYPRFKKNRKEMDPWHQYMIEAALYQFSPVIFYLNPSRLTISENLLSRGDDYIDPSEIDDMIDAYQYVIGRSLLPIVTYDFKVDDLEKKINEAMNIHLESQIACYTKMFLSSGSSKKEGIMIIGDEPSDKSVGEGYIRAFISDKGSSEFLHRSLFEAGIYNKEMPYFTNWGKGLDNNSDKLEALTLEINNLNPRKIILLGKNLLIESFIKNSEKLENNPLTKSYKDKFFKIDHPSYVKRFRSKDYQYYVNQIKEIYEGKGY